MINFDGGKWWTSFFFYTIDILGYFHSQIYMHEINSKIQFNESFSFVLFSDNPNLACKKRC